MVDEPVLGLDRLRISARRSARSASCIPANPPWSRCSCRCSRSLIPQMIVSSADAAATSARATSMVSPALIDAKAATHRCR